MTIAAARQFLVTTGATGNRTYTEFAGGAKEGETTKWRDGGAVVPQVLGGPPETGDVTLKNGFDPERDGPMIQNLLRLVSVLRTTVTKVPLHGDMSRIQGAPPLVYTGCLLKSVKPPESNANSGDVATYELVFSVEDVT